MICKNCGNETGARYDCTACGYDPTKDDPEVVKNMKPIPAEVAPPPVEIVLRKKANIPAILGFVSSILMCIPIPVVGVISCPVCWFVAIVLGIIGFFKAKSCRSGRIFSIIAISLCALLVVFIAVSLILVAVLGGAGFLAQILALFALYGIEV